MLVYQIKARAVHVGDMLIMHSGRRRKPGAARVKLVHRYPDGTVRIQTRAGDNMLISENATVQIER